MKLNKIIYLIIVIMLVISIKAYATEIQNETIISNEIVNTYNIEKENEKKDEYEEEQENKNIITSASPVTKNKKSNIVNKSDNNYIKTLNISQGELSPEFNKDITKYYTVVDLNVKNITTKVTLLHNKSKVIIKGNKNLKEGKNTIELIVTAENGSKRTYYIYVTKTENKEKANANLSKLEIEDYNISPEFKSNVYIYNITIKDKVDKLNIITKSENENAQVDIIGNNNLGKEEKTIKINVIAEDGVTIKEYKINIKKSFKEINKKEEDKRPAIIVIIILGIIILILFINVLKRNKK